MNLKEVVKNTLMTLQKDGVNATPDEYKRVFCQEAKKAKLSIGDCSEHEKYLPKLNDKLKLQLKNYPIKNIDEFVAFLIAIASRNAPEETKNSTVALVSLIKKISQVIMALHNKEATLLANETIHKADMLLEPQNAEKMREKWNEFATKYNDSFLDEWSRFLKITRTDFKSFSEEALSFLEKSSIKDHLPSIYEEVRLSFLPSINKQALIELEKEFEDVKNDKNLLLDRNTLNRIKGLVQKRVAFDKEEIDNKASELAKIIDVIYDKVGKLSDKNAKIYTQLSSVKHKISQIGLSDVSIDDIKSELKEITETIGIELESLDYEIYRKQKEIEELKDKVLHLERELEKSKKESITDVLTGVGTKRFLLDEIARFEALYERHQTEYSIVFLDIDFFKKINDTHGHDAGDKVLASFGAIIKKYARKEDIVSRYGGEEFIVILPETDVAGGVMFANKIREAVENSKFLYKETIIKVTVSAGVSQRSKCYMSDEAIKMADEELYKAKRNGRNRVYPII